MNQESLSKQMGPPLVSMKETMEQTFTQSELEAIATALADTSVGLTGSEIGHILSSLKIASIATLLGKERELFPFQQASLLMALRYFLIIDPETWSQIWRLSRLRSINWNTRRQAARLLSMKDLGRNGLAWAMQAFEKEDNVEVKRAWIQCLTQLPREELEQLSRSFTLSIHSKLQRPGQFLMGFFLRSHIAWPKLNLFSGRAEKIF
jgi:hypothetical protein